MILIERLRRNPRIGYSIWLILSGVGCVIIFCFEMFSFMSIAEDPYFHSLVVIRNMNYELYFGTDDLTDEELIPLIDKCFGPSASDLSVIKDIAIAEFVLNPPSPTTFDWNVACRYPLLSDRIRQVAFMSSLAIQCVCCIFLLVFFVDVPKQKALQSDAIFTIAQNSKELSIHDDL